MKVGSTLLLVFFVSALCFADSRQWTDKFNVSSCSWSSTGRNDFFILEPGYQQVLEGRDGKDAVRLVVTVLNETKNIGGVETRVVEENETHNGQTVEISRNYFAVCKPSNDIFYFGEDVDMYKNGKVTSHEGTWAAETHGAKAGLFMPSRPLIGARYYQELAPNVAMDRVEIANDTESLMTPAGTFHDCVKTDETTPLEPGAKEHKIFARGVGLVQDGKLVLMKYGSVAAEESGRHARSERASRTVAYVSPGETPGECGRDGRSPLGGN